MGKNKNGLKKYDNVGYFFVLPFVIVHPGSGLTTTSVYSQTNFSGERFGTR